MPGRLDHVPVMVKEVLGFLQVRPKGRYLDLTLGGGGHARTILLCDSTCTLVGVDRDREILDRTREELAGFGSRFQAIWSRFDQLADNANEVVRDGFDGVLLDLGMSSIQVDDPDRGFSFDADGPLDLRMDRSAGQTAAELLRRIGERELADLLYHYGDERRSRAIAREIVRRRKVAPIRRTLELTEVIRSAFRGRRGKIHPATRTFQALRIAVNEELQCLERVLPQVVEWLRDDGRLVVLSFHSGEDRIVKNFLREQAREGRLKLLTRKVVRPEPEEVSRNARARSTRLRSAQKLADAD